MKVGLGSGLTVKGSTAKGANADCLFLLRISLKLPWDRIRRWRPLGKLVVAAVAEVVAAAAVAESVS